MNDDAILKIMEYVVLGEGAIELSPTVKKRALEAAQQIRQFILDEIIGEDEPKESDFTQSEYNLPGVSAAILTSEMEIRNQLRAEQRQKLK